MRSREVQHLIDAVEAAYGTVELFGSVPTEEHGTCFKLAGTPATFSIHTRDGTLPPGQFDVQIEGVPQGDYIYTAVVPLDEFLELVARVRGPEDQWPGPATAELRGSSVAGLAACAWTCGQAKAVRCRGRPEPSASTESGG